jgi:hypothetical protein
MVKKRTKRHGGMIRAFGRPLGKATLALGESVGKDYLQNKSAKISKGIYDDASLATNPGFLMTGIKPMSAPNIKIYDKENINSENSNPNIKINVNSNLYDNFGGRTKIKCKTKRKCKSKIKYKIRKTRKNRK